MGLAGGSQSSKAIEFETPETRDLQALGEWLRALGLSASLTASLPAPGELGAGDVLTVLAGSSVLSTAIKTLPDFLRSRRSGLRLEASVRGRKITVDAHNVEEVLPIIERLVAEDD